MILFSTVVSIATAQTSEALSYKERGSNRETVSWLGLGEDVGIGVTIPAFG